MKSNPYVYPYVPFKDPSNTTIQDNMLSPKTVAIAEIGKLLESVPRPSIASEGAAVSEKIFSVFLDDAIRFGPREFIVDYQKFWIEKLEYFIARKEPIQFTILGFPFKIPVPLKTNRILPDMGEALSLHRLAVIMDTVRDLYAPGARVTVFAEGGFGRFADVPDTDWMAYRDGLKRLVQELGFSDRIHIRDLSDMEQEVADFPERHEKKVAELRKLFEKKDDAFMKAYMGARESLEHIVSTIGQSEEALLAVYNDNLMDADASPEVRTIREDIRNRTHETIFKYYAYLRVRDDLAYVEKTVPHALALSVSPKPYRLGVLPVDKECIRLPSHGVPVYGAARNAFSIEYLIDIKRNAHTYTPVHLQGDSDAAPFYYVVDA